MNKPVITRIAPSPTGNLHIGTVRTALFNFLFAKHTGGTFILRIEDTDKERSKKEFEQDILEGLSWLKLKHDALYRQSDRTAFYTDVIEQLLDSEKAYVSKEKSKAEPGVEVEVVRLKNPGTTITFNDLIRGDVSFDTTELGDFVIARSITEPLYHLAVVSDDNDMEVTHVIRGEDHISNTPRQILIGEALGYVRPQYAHIPLILAPDRSKLSKRGTTTSIAEYSKMGYLREALVNYLALLGWNPGTDQELFTIDELIKSFSIEDIQKGGAVFDTVKLDWFNREYIQKLPKEEFVEKVKEYLPKKFEEQEQYSENRVEAFSSVLLEKIHRFGEIEELAEQGEFDYFFVPPTYEVSLLPQKDNPGAEAIGEHLTQISKLLDCVEEGAFTTDSVKSAVWDYADEQGRGTVLWPMRVALSGKKQSPDPFKLAEIFGKKETLARLATAIRSL